MSENLKMHFLILHAKLFKLNNVRSKNFVTAMDFYYIIINALASITHINNSYKIKYRKSRAILYTWKTADRIESGFSLNDRAKQGENKSD